jgi:uncharacterized membrane protein
LADAGGFVFAKEIRRDGPCGTIEIAAVAVALQKGEDFTLQVGIVRRRALNEGLTRRSAPAPRETVR